MPTDYLRTALDPIFKYCQLNIGRDIIFPWFNLEFQESASFSKWKRKYGGWGLFFQLWHNNGSRTKTLWNHWLDFDLKSLSDTCLNINFMSSIICLMVFLYKILIWCVLLTIKLTAFDWSFTHSVVKKF